MLAEALEKGEGIATDKAGAPRSIARRPRRSRDAEARKRAEEVLARAGTSGSSQR